MSALVVAASAVGRGDGLVALLCGDPEETASLTSTLVAHGCVRIASDMTEIDPEHIEVAGTEVRLVVLLTPDPDAVAPDVREMSEGEAAYAVGSRATSLADVPGGPLPALARLGRRTRGYEVRYADPTAAAREVLQRWPNP